MDSFLIREQGDGKFLTVGIARSWSGEVYGYIPDQEAGRCMDIEFPKQGAGRCIYVPLLGISYRQGQQTVCSPTAPCSKRACRTLFGLAKHGMVEKGKIG